LRVIALERVVREMKAESSKPTPQTSITFYPAWLMGMLASLLTVGYYYVLLVEPGTGLKVENVSLLLPPVVFGILLGLVGIGKQSQHYLLAGLLLGLANLNAIWFVFSDKGVGFEWPWGLAIFVLGYPAVVWTGAVLGRVVQRRWLVVAETAPAAVEVDIWLDRIARRSENLKVIYTVVLQIGADVALLIGHYLLKAPTS
jgi:hypothetical protein